MQTPHCLRRSLLFAVPATGTGCTLWIAVFGAVAALALGILLVSFGVTAEEIELGRVVLSPPCVLKSYFGIECFSCGLTRAFCCLSHGEFQRALAYHRLAPLVYVLVWGMFVGAAFETLRGLVTLRQVSGVRREGTLRRSFVSEKPAS